MIIYVMFTMIINFKPEVASKDFKEGHLEWLNGLWQAIRTNWCLLTLPLHAPVSVGHNGLDHWFRG